MQHTNNGKGNTMQQSEQKCSHLKLEEIGTAERPRHKLSIRKTPLSEWNVVDIGCSLKNRYELFEFVLKSSGEDGLWRVYKGEDVLKVVGEGKTARPVG